MLGKIQMIFDKTGHFSRFFTLNKSDSAQKLATKQQGFATIIHLQPIGGGVIIDSESGGRINSAYQNMR